MQKCQSCDSAISEVGRSGAHVIQNSRAFSWVSEVLHLKLVSGEVSGAGKSQLLKSQTHRSLAGRLWGSLLHPRASHNPQHLLPVQGGPEIPIPRQHVGRLLSGTSGLGRGLEDAQVML